MLGRLASPWLRCLRPKLLGRRLTSNEVKELSPTPLQLQLATAASLAGLGGLTLLSGRFLNFAKEDASEKVWFGDRGPLSSERSIAVLPTAMCVSSGCLAAVLQKLYPTHISHLVIPYRVHEMLALPLSLLLAFRFQGSYDRWWNSRMKFSDLVGQCVALAEYMSTFVPKKLEDDLDPAKVEAHKEAIRIRRRFLLILEAYLLFVEEKIHGSDFDPHPSNAVKAWPRGEDVLKEEFPEDAEACRACRDTGEPIVWCSSAMLSCISQLGDLEILDGDNAAMAAESIMNFEQGFIECMVVVVQDSPAPFIVHHRTIMTLFCLTFPFAIINHVGYLAMVPIQTLISFAFLGSEYCSQEMEHPFGADAGSIPVRKIIEGGRSRIRHTRDLEF